MYASVLCCATGTYSVHPHSTCAQPPTQSCTTALPVTCLICAVTHGQLLMHPSTLGPATTDGYRLPVCVHSRGELSGSAPRRWYLRAGGTGAMRCSADFAVAVGTVRHVCASVPTHHGSSVEWGMVVGQLLCAGAAHRCTRWRRLFAGHEEHF